MCGRITVDVGGISARNKSGKRAARPVMDYTLGVNGPPFLNLSHFSRRRLRPSGLLATPTQNNCQPLLCFSCYGAVPLSLFTVKIYISSLFHSPPASSLDWQQSQQWSRRTTNPHPKQNPPTPPPCVPFFGMESTPLLQIK